MCQHFGWEGLGRGFVGVGRVDFPCGRKGRGVSGGGDLGERVQYVPKEGGIGRCQSEEGGDQCLRRWEDSNGKSNWNGRGGGNCQQGCSATETRTLEEMVLGGEDALLDTQPGESIPDTEEMGNKN